MNDKKFIKTKVTKSLRKLLGKVHLSSYELLRLNNLGTMVSSILLTGRSELRQIAYGNFERKKYSSKVKQFKRLLLNKHINASTYFLPYIKPLLEVLGSSGKLVFSIDGSVVGKGCMCLMFSIIYKGRALPVVWKVYKSKKGHLSEDAHRSLLKELSEIVPNNCRIVITGDGEFDGCDWQADILKHGWDYVVKTGRNTQIKEGGWDDFKPKSVCLEQGDDLF
jgi:hypothetical protein